MSLLSELIDSTKGVPPAIPANSAIPQVPISGNSEISRGYPFGADVRARLLRLADTYGFDRALVDRVPIAELPEYADMSGPYLIALLDALQDDADIDAGRVPRGWTTLALCAHCGLVWLHHAVADLLIVKDGWPYAPLGCPWCRARKAGRFIPRPPETRP